jgi:hypothetical protein
MQKMTWYKVLNDIVRTNVRLHSINMTATHKCRHCDEPDTLDHRISKCGAGRLMWTWTATKIATILRTNARYIPTDWTLCPACEMWPRRRKRAAGAACYLPTRKLQCNNANATTLLDYVNYVRCCKEKLYTNPGRRSLVANYLLVVDE